MDFMANLPRSLSFVFRPEKDSRVVGWVASQRVESILSRGWGGLSAWVFWSRISQTSNPSNPLPKGTLQQPTHKQKETEKRNDWEVEVYSFREDNTQKEGYHFGKLARNKFWVTKVTFYFLPWGKIETVLELFVSSLLVVIGVSFQCDTRLNPTFGTRIV